MPWFPSPDYADWWYDLSWKGIIGFGALAASATAATVVFTMLQFWSDSIRDQKAEERSKTMEVQLAEANARTKEAELKLEQLRRQVAPRRLNREAFLKVLEGQPSARVEIVYLRDDPECFALAQQTWSALADAQWAVVPPVPIPPNTAAEYLLTPTAMSVGGQPSGVTVVTHAVSPEEAEAIPKRLQSGDWIRTPWTVLTHAFGQALGKVGGSGGGLYSPPEGTLRVVIAPRL